MFYLLGSAITLLALALYAGFKYDSNMDFDSVVLFIVLGFVLVVFWIVAIPAGLMFLLGRKLTKG